jgi:hypothetical protein
MRKMLVALPMTLAAATVLSTAPIPMSSTVSEAKPISVQASQQCSIGYGVCYERGCLGLNSKGQPVKGVPPLSGAGLTACTRQCEKDHAQCMKTGSWPSRGAPYKPTVGGGVLSPGSSKQPGGGVVVPKQPGGGVATPKWNPKSPPIGTYHPRPPFDTTGPVGTWHSGGSSSGPTLLRSGGRR